jgi:hypothetical protein
MGKYNLLILQFGVQRGTSIAESAQWMMFQKICLIGQWIWIFKNKKREKLWPHPWTNLIWITTLRATKFEIITPLLSLAKVKNGEKQIWEYKILLNQWAMQNGPQ